MPLFNAGAPIIDAYLKGVAIKQQKEKQVQDFELTREEMRMKQAQYQENLKLANSKFDAMVEKNALEAKFRQADLDIKKFRSKEVVARLLKDNLIAPVDPNKEMDFDAWDNIRPTTAEERANTRIGEKVREAKAMIEPGVQKIIAETGAKAEQAGAIQQARLPAQFALNQNEAELREAAAKKQREFISEQNRLNRDASFERAQLVQSGRLAATKEDKAKLIQDSVDQSREDAIQGNITQEDLNKKLTGDNKVKVYNALKGEGITVLRDQDRNDLQAIPMVQRFFEKAKRLNDLIKAKGQFATVDPDYHTLQKELQQDLDAFGRAVKGFKGLITEKDTQRLVGGIPQALPGGALSWLSSGKKINSDNQRRLDALENMVHDKFRLLTKNMSSNQRESIRERYEIFKPKIADHLERGPKVK